LAYIDPSEIQYHSKATGTVLQIDVNNCQQYVCEERASIHSTLSQRPTKSIVLSASNKFISKGNLVFTQRISITMEIAVAFAKKWTIRKYLGNSAFNLYLTANLFPPLPPSRALQHIRALALCPLHSKILITF
jgi:hypothetical protein